MIAQFPSFYPDELVYSLLARYYTQSGYMRYTFAAEDLFERRTVKPDIEFFNRLTGEGIKNITRTMSLETIIQKHTMFPYYARFIDKERREKAFDSLKSMDGKHYNLLPIRKKRDASIRYLRYCPICAKKDRENHGETYWHRLHQMPDVTICSTHFCKLIDTDIPISSKASPSLITAEEIVPTQETIIMSEGEIEKKVSQYVANVFMSEIDMQLEIRAGDFLYSRMEHTKYLSLRGQQRNITLFHKEFLEYYKNLPENKFVHLWQLQKVFSNDRFNLFEICLMAMFLDISANELVNMRLPEKSQKQLFDEKVKELHGQGLKYPEIAKRMNTSYDLVKTIGGGRYGKYHHFKENPQKAGSKRKDWNQIDEKYLPEVKKVIQQLWGNKEVRPKKVTVGAVQRVLGVSKKGFQNCPMCVQEIKKYQESQEEYWAREVVWAVDTIRRNGVNLSRTRIEKLTNMRKKDFIACMPYLQNYEGEYASILESII